MYTKSRQYKLSTEARKLGTYEKRKNDCLVKFGARASVTLFWADMAKKVIDDMKSNGLWEHELDDIWNQKARDERERARLGKPMLKGNFE